MLELMVAVFGSLFSVVNPFGAVPVFLAMTPHYTEMERNRTARNTALYFVLILLAFYLGGSWILGFFGISLNAMRIAGGLIILNSGYALLNGKFAESRAINNKVKEEALSKDDISFSPMAMPMLSGPGSISLLIGLYAEHTTTTDRFLIAGVVLLVGFSVFLILRSSPYLFRLMGEAGIKALSRIMGFLVMAIGIQYVISGIVHLVQHLA